MEQTAYTTIHAQSTNSVGELDHQTKEWLDQVYEKIEIKLEWVSENQRIRFHI